MNEPKDEWKQFWIPTKPEYLRLTGKRIEYKVSDFRGSHSGVGIVDVVVGELVSVEIISDDGSTRVRIALPQDKVDAITDYPPELENPLKADLLLKA